MSAVSWNIRVKQWYYTSDKFQIVWHRFTALHCDSTCQLNELSSGIFKINLKATISGNGNLHNCCALERRAFGQAICHAALVYGAGYIRAGKIAAAVPILLNMQGSSVLQILPSPVNPGFLMLSLFPSLHTHGLPASSRIRDHSCDENHGLDKYDALGKWSKMVWCFRVTGDFVPSMQLPWSGHGVPSWHL